MKVTPVRQYSEAKYTTKPILDAHPEVLRLIPQRWQANPVVLAALTSLVTLAAGCKQAAAQSNQPVGVVAPIFIHGEGRGTFGCEAVNPPVFLSEAEAFEVIYEEAKKAGINFAKGGPELGGIEKTVHVPFKPDKTVKLKAEGSNAKRDISFVFVSYDDAFNWNPLSMSSVDRFDVKKDAEKLVKEIEVAKLKGPVGVFYDPFASPQRQKATSWEQIMKEAKEVDKAELRKQVKDFIQWLKAQKVI